MATIKTRYAVKGSIKAIDKAKIASQKMKQTYVATKDKIEEQGGENKEDVTVEADASQQVVSSGTATAVIGAQKLHHLGRKSVSQTGQRMQKAKEAAASFRQSFAKRTYSKEFTEHSSTLTQQVRQPFRQQQGQRCIRTASKAEKSIKTWGKSAGKQTIKTAKRAASKTAKRSIKTADFTSKGAIKTAKASAYATHRARQTAAQTAHRARQAAKAARAASRAAARAARRTIRVTLAALRAAISGTRALLTALFAGGWIAILVILIVVMLASAVSMFGGGNSSNTYTAVSAEVNVYEPLIRKYAAEHGIPEYVELLKAMMMQESGDRGLDPMQAAEGSFNTRYPHVPNGTQDPEYSIACGVQELKSVLQATKVENPLDMEHIKLALQGYNFGGGYITWAVDKYGGYSYTNAVEFSTMQAAKLGWERYGDTQYVSHVLRYYPYGRAFTTGGDTVIVEVALSQVGNEADSLTGRGTDFPIMWIGAPALCPGVQSNAAISTPGSSLSLLYVPPEKRGSRRKDNGQIEPMSRRPEILSSSTGTETG